VWRNYIYVCISSSFSNMSHSLCFLLLISFSCLRNVFLLCTVYFIAHLFYISIELPMLCSISFYPSLLFYVIFPLWYSLQFRSWLLFLLTSYYSLFSLTRRFILFLLYPFTFSLLSVTFNTSLPFSSFSRLFYHLLILLLFLLPICMLVLSSILYTFKCFWLFSPLVFHPTVPPNVFSRPLLLRILTFLISQFSSVARLLPVLIHFPHMYLSLIYIKCILSSHPHHSLSYHYFSLLIPQSLCLLSCSSPVITIFRNCIPVFWPPCIPTPHTVSSPLLIYPPVCLALWKLP
jgi:hypothetical protein